MSVPDLRGQRISVLGAARSGLAVTGLLRSRGATLFVSDSAPAATMEAAESLLAQFGIAREFGANSSRVLEADLIVVSPGIPSSIPVLREAAARGIRVVSELEVASWCAPGPIVAVTGTNGKTTTTTLIGRMLEDARLRPAVAGNIGTAFSEVVGTMQEGQPAVLEVSSFQLDYIDTFRPRVAMILNITPDHLDRYNHSLAEYVASKCRVFRNQGAGDVLIVNTDDPLTREAVTGRVHPDVRLLTFSRGTTTSDGAWIQDDTLVTSVRGEVCPVIALQEISIRGLHNHYNAMAATLAAQVMGVSAGSIRTTLQNFRGVEHRLEVVREKDGILYINDSKATNVDSVWYALQSFDRPLVVLLGGRDKGNDYTRLEELVRKNVRAIVAIGESADKVEAAFRRLVPVTSAGSMEDAVQRAREAARPGDVVLLSPACASFDWFTNYEHRGRVFKEIVMGL